MRFPATASQSVMPATISAALVVLGGSVIAPLVELGPLSALMAQHVLIMNVIAPLAAAFLAPMLSAWADRGGALWGSGLAQILALWTWHTPALQRAAASLPALHLVLQVALLAAAILFWAALLRAGAKGRWSAVAALLVTGKLACLLGALLIFAPRELYELASLAFSICAVDGPATLADQHLAGLLMVAACPLSYVVAGIVIAAQMLADLEHRAQSHPGPMGSIAP